MSLDGLIRSGLALLVFSESELQFWLIDSRDGGLKRLKVEFEAKLDRKTD